MKVAQRSGEIDKVTQSAAPILTPVPMVVGRGHDALGGYVSRQP
jgi:hypothetical protein